MTLEPSQIRSFVDDLSELRDELRETVIANGRVQLSVRVMLDGWVLAHAIGSPHLCLAALREGLLDASFLLTSYSNVRVELQHVGERSELVDKFYKREA